MTEKLEPLSCPDPDKITDCQDCVKKGLATCGWADEQGFKDNTDITVGHKRSGNV